MSVCVHVCLCLCVCVYSAQLISVLTVSAENNLLENWMVITRDILLIKKLNDKRKKGHFGADILHLGCFVHTQRQNKMLQKNQTNSNVEFVQP